MMAINLVVKVEIGSEPAGASGIDAALRIAEDELSRGWLAIVIEHVETDADSGIAREDYR